MLEWSLVENIQRADLNPIERATGYRDYMDRFGLSQGQAAERLGQARATVANYVRMLDLCGEVQQLLIDAALTFGHGKVLAGLAGEEPKQLAVARKIVAEGLSVRQAEALAAIVRLGSGQPDRALVVKPPGRAKPAYLLDLEQRLCQCVGTRVRILPSRAKHSGRIVVEYYSLDDFDRITGRLGLGAEGLAGPTA
jgi:ParB family chromosome partitioning protein